MRLMQKHWGRKRLIVFDLDGTLARSKLPVTKEMMRLLKKLLEKKEVAIIGGGKYGLFQEQLLSRIAYSEALLRKLYVFPTNSTSFYRRDRTWKKVYAHALSRTERSAIIAAFKKAFRDVRYAPPSKVYGTVLEDRGTQVTFSAAGQKAPVRIKEAWNKTSDRRPEIMRAMKKYLRAFEVRRGGLTSIDVTRKGIDKAYGIRQIEKQLGISRRDMLFVGDAIYPGGNDYAVVKTGVDYVKVKDPEETKKIIRALIA